MPVVSGIRSTLARSVPVIAAAAINRFPAAAPAHTIPASAPHARATTSPPAAINSSMSMKCCPASSMAANTSGRMIDPPSAVTQLRALITFVTPRRS